MDEQAEESILIEQTLQGDQRAYGQLATRYSGALYGLAYRMLGNQQDAEDAVQEILIRAYTRLVTFDQNRRFSTWLLSIASNYCIDLLRKRRFTWITLDDIEFSMPSLAPGPERSAIRQEQQELVQQALQQLPEHYRLVTILLYWHDLSYEEISTVTGLSISTIKTRLHRARNMLAKALGPEGQMLWEAETIPS
jgi:RNA polymerase sigma-70 factor (ECF subfamily)